MCLFQKDIPAEVGQVVILSPVHGLGPYIQDCPLQCSPEPRHTGPETVRHVYKQADIVN